MKTKLLALALAVRLAAADTATLTAPLTISGSATITASQPHRYTAKEIDDLRQIMIYKAIHGYTYPTGSMRFGNSESPLSNGGTHAANEPTSQEAQYAEAMILTAVAANLTASDIIAEDKRKYEERQATAPKPEGGK